MELLLPGGTLLAAWPGLPDPNFARSAIVICEHSEQGAYGLVFNRELEVTVGELLPEHPLLGGLHSAVALGGPVERSRLQFLHMLPGRIRGGVEICTGLWMGGELDALAEVLAEAERGQAPEPPVKLFLGYAGWGEGQLEGELLSRSWMPAPFDGELLFGEGGDPAWEALVERADPDRRERAGGGIGDPSAN